MFMRIRLLKKNEIKEVAKLLTEAYESETKDRRWSEKYAEKYIWLLYRMCSKLCFVAVEDGKIVGVTLNVIIPEFNKEVIESRVLVVHPDYRRKKIGTKLINFPITWYECLGFRTKKYYETTRANIANILNKV